jgi:hypothetical protein
VAKKEESALYCCQPERGPEIILAAMDYARSYSIRVSRKKWVNGTVLHFYFLEKDQEWDWPTAQKDVVHWAFEVWHDVGIGLSFQEVEDPADAEVRIGRKPNQRSWSYVGKDVLDYEIDGCTMNFGWDLTTRWGHATALHEIGHTIGFEHEHQNFKSGIVWDEEAVYESFLRTNKWKRDETYTNVIQKLSPNGAEGSEWDPTSIMHYPFDPGLIRVPKPYDTNGIGENTELSRPDKDWALYWYPANPTPGPLGVMEVARLTGGNGSQHDFEFRPEATRHYDIRTIGQADSRLVLFEMRDGQPRHYDAADDAGTPENASIKAKLVAGRKYIVRARTHFQPPGAEAGLLIV